MGARNHTRALEIILEEVAVNDRFVPGGKILRLHGHRGYAVGIISSLNSSLPRFHPCIVAGYRVVARERWFKSERERVVHEGCRSIDDNDPVDDSLERLLYASHRCEIEESEILRKGGERERKKKGEKTCWRGAFVFQELEAIGRRHYSHRSRLPHDSRWIFSSPFAPPILLYSFFFSRRNSLLSREDPCYLSYLSCNERLI